MTSTYHTHPVYARFEYRQVVQYLRSFKNIPYDSKAKNVHLWNSAHLSSGMQEQKTVYHKRLALFC